MNNLKDIQENYESKNVEDLIHLALNPQELRLEVIPILQKELLNRGQTEEAMSLTDFLVKAKEKPRFSDLPKAELRKLIKDRLATGEPMESIKIDLKDDGVNIYEIINNDHKLKEKAYNYITHLKEQGLEEEEIDEKLKETLSIEKEDTEMLKIQLKKSGKKNLIFGYTISIIALLLLTIALGTGGSVGFGAIFVLGFGVWTISKGYEQIKK